MAPWYGPNNYATVCLHAILYLFSTIWTTHGDYLVHGLCHCAKFGCNRYSTFDNSFNRPDWPKKHLFTSPKCCLKYTCGRFPKKGIKRAHGQIRTNFPVEIAVIIHICHNFGDPLRQGRSHILYFVGDGKWSGTPRTSNKAATPYWSSIGGGGLGYLPSLWMKFAAVIRSNHAADWAEGATLCSQGVGWDTNRLPTEMTMGGPGGRMGDASPVVVRPLRWGGRSNIIISNWPSQSF